MVKASEQQQEAWGYYGGLGACHPIGEVRYVIGWIADQMARLDWIVTIDGKSDWVSALKNSSGEVIGVSEDVSLLDASRELLSKAINWDDKTVKKITKNLFVSGEYYYLADDKDNWDVVSIIDKDLEVKIKKAALSFRGLWEHPADAESADPPLEGVLPILAALVWLTKLSDSQSKNRIATTGIVGASSDLQGYEGATFEQTLKEAFEAKIKNPNNFAPVVITGATDLIAPTSGGMAGLSWVIPQYPYDDKIDDRIEKLIKRLAYGLPIPPEILLGMQAQSRATAFQVEENSYRAHIQPPAEMIAEMAARALSAVLSGKDENKQVEVKVYPDPARLLARPRTVQDAADAFDRRAVSFDYYREALGIPADAAPTDEDFQLWEKIDAIKSQAQRDPAAIVAAIGGSESDPLTDRQLNKLADEIVDLDSTILAELVGATALAVQTAREKVGAKARTFEAVRALPNLLKEVANSEVVNVVGLDILLDIGVPIEEIVTKSLHTTLAKWWKHRAKQFGSQLKEIVETFDTLDVDSSLDKLINLSSDHIIETLESPIAQSLPVPKCVEVMTILGGVDDPKPEILGG